MEGACDLRPSVIGCTRFCEELARICMVLAARLAGHCGQRFDRCGRGADVFAGPRQAGIAPESWLGRGRRCGSATATVSGETAVRVRDPRGYPCDEARRAGVAVVHRRTGVVDDVVDRAGAEVDGQHVVQLHARRHRNLEPVRGVDRRVDVGEDVRRRRPTARGCSTRRPTL